MNLPRYPQCVARYPQIPEWRRRNREERDMAIKHKVVSEDDWLKARKKLLTKEKKFLRMQDALSAERRSLPWVKVTKPYVFEGPDGEVTLGRPL